MRVVLLAAVSLTLAGCVAKWGRSFNVALANSNTVVVEYDPVVVDMPALLRAAQAECEKFGKDAVSDYSGRGNLGIVVAYFRCEKRTG